MVERVLSMHEVPGSMPGSSTFNFVFFSVKSVCWCQNVCQSKFELEGGLAQMVERVLSMHDVPGSMPRFSTLLFVFFSVKSVCWCQNVCQSKVELEGGISSNGRARA